MSAEHTSSPRTICITGASRGIGAAIARELAAPERHLVLIARSADALQELARELETQGATAEVLAADLSDAEDLRRVCDSLASRPDDPIDTIVLNAGYSTNTDFADSEAAVREYEMRLNYFAPTEILHSVLPDMRTRQRGRILATGSLTALVPFPGNANYAGSKGALLSFLRSLAGEVRSYGITITSVLPGLVRTKMTRDLSAPLLWMVPSQGPADVAREVARYLDRGPAVVIPGPANALLSVIFQLFPDAGNLLVDILGPWIVPRPAQDQAKPTAAGEQTSAST